MNAYGGHMNKVYREMETLKKKADENEFKMRREQLIVKLQTQASWFRVEAQDLRKVNKALVQKLKDLQERVRVVEQNSLFVRHENAKVKAEKD